MSQENESNIQLHITKVEELYNSSRVTTEKKLNKISKQLEALDMIVRKVNAKKKKGKEIKGYDKRVSKIEAKISTFPQQLEENDKKLEDVIAKIINIESSKCDYVPTSSTAIILDNLKETLRVEINQKEKSFQKVVDQDQD